MITAIRKLMGADHGHAEAAEERRRLEAESRKTLHEAATSVHYLEVSAELMARRRALKKAQDASAANGEATDMESTE